MISVRVWARPGHKLFKAEKLKFWEYPFFSIGTIIVNIWFSFTYSHGNDVFSL